MAGRKVSIADAIGEWMDWRKKNAAPTTVETQGIVVRQWMRGHLKEGWACNRINDENIDEFVNESKTSRASRDVRLSSIRSFVGFCAARAYLVGNPAKNVKVRLRGMTHEQKEPERVLPATESQYRKLLEKAEGFWKFAIPLSYWTGLRLSDVACLEWASIHADSIIVWNMKTGKRVELALSEPLIGGGELVPTLLQMSLESAGGAYCFPSEREVIMDTKRRARLSVYFSRLCAKAGVENITFHSLRHSFVTRLHKAGKTLEEIGKAVGHSNTETTKGYAHETDSEKATDYVAGVLAAADA